MNHPTLFECLLCFFIGFGFKKNGVGIVALTYLVYILARDLING